MTNSPTSSVPNTTSRVNYFTGLARKRRRFSLLPANGDGSTLSLDFTTGVLDPRLTFTRSTSGMYIGADGLVKTMAAAPTNDPTKARFDHDPTTLAPKGLLIEGSAVNLAAYSNLQAAWAGGTNTTPTANTTEVLSPDGTNNATKIALGSASYCSRFESITGLAASTAYTFSYWIRGTAGNQQRVYSVTAGADLVTQTTLSYSTTGWTRVQINFTTTAAISNVYIYVVSRPTGTASDVVYIWGAQLETGTGASSLIPTGASTGSRAADSCVMTGTNFSSWYLSATAGTLYSEFDNPRASLGVAQTPASFGLGDYSAGNLISAYLGAYPVGQALNAAIWGSGGTGFQAATVPTSVSVATGNKAACAFSGQSVMGGFRGNASALATTTGTVNAKTVLYIGGNGASGTTNRDFLNSCVQRIKFFPTQFTAAQLKALTT